MLQPENQTKKYEHLFADIDSGRTKVPMFQRDFVWSDTQTAKLIDSIIKGFPIGAFIFWQTRDELRHIRNIGNISLPDTPKGESRHYVLDGQQRITSLYAVRKGVRITREGQEVDYTKISIDLSRDPDAEEEIVTAEPPTTGPYITVFELLNGSFAELAEKFDSKELRNRIDIYRSRLTGYDFSTIVIRDYPLEVACEVFTRINTGGTVLTLFQIMVAKTYDETRKFDLAMEYDWLIDNKGREKDLEDANFDTISPSTVLQCIAAHLIKAVRARDILKLDRDNVIDNWPIVKEGIFAAVDYLRTHLRVPVSKLLPYDALLVPLTYFFIRMKNDESSPIQDKLLTQYFWWASLSNRFTSGSEGKIARDLLRMEDILAENPPDYTGEEVRISIDELRWRRFRAGEAFCKAILCLYAYHEPQSFQSNSLIKLDNSWLRIATSKNYHHFFPKDYLAKAGMFSDEQANSILNITLVDDYLNKRKIRAKAPSAYMKGFAKHNNKIKETMKTHLINDMDAFGVWQDDFSAFVEQRGRRVLQELEIRLRPDLS
jgi:hypothetical protein